MDNNTKKSSSNKTSQSTKSKKSTSSSKNGFRNRKSKKQAVNNAKNKMAKSFAKKNSNRYDGAEFVTGMVDGNPKGFGFLICDDKRDDVYIPVEKLNGAMHGDKVEAVIYSRGKRPDAEVLKVISKSSKQIVGVYQSFKGYGLCYPDSKRVAQEIYIPLKDSLMAQTGQKVVVEITSTPRGKKPGGVVKEILGYLDDKNIDLLSVMREYNLYQEFPSNVILESEGVAHDVTQEERKGRVDYSKDLTITIDGDDSKDFDDAVYAYKKDNNNYVLHVHIADVAHYVAPKSKLDTESFKRGTSVYMPGLVVPMLPKLLSNGICSLNQGEERLTLSVEMNINASGEVTKFKIAEGIMVSKARTTYTKVSNMLGGDDSLRNGELKDIAPMIDTMHELADILYNKRKSRGNIEFDIPECEIIMDSNGKVADIKRRPRLVAHKIIEEFMIVANETVAKYSVDNSLPFVYRSHEAPPQEKIEGLLDFLSAVGINFTGDIKEPKSIDFANLLEKVDESLINAVSTVTLRSMSKATYEPTCDGHFGLASEFYSHFTAPIRRYPDLAIHRVLKEHLKNPKSALKKYEEFVSEVSRHCSATERDAQSAERDADDIKKAEYMSDKIGNEYIARISGVTEWGLFAELENTVEGLIRAESMPSPVFDYYEKQYMIKSGDKTFRIGDTIKIKVHSVEEFKINFDYINEDTKENTEDIE